jgi:hypothetical protein
MEIKTANESTLYRNGRASSDRSTEDVFRRHLELRKHGELETDIAENYSHDVVILCCTGIWRGHDGVRECAAELENYLPNAEFEYNVMRSEREFAFLTWTGKSESGDVHDGADSFVIRDGKIVAQTINYNVKR